MTVTATDDAGFSDSASFTWAVTNAVSVTGPGDQSGLSGTAISPGHRFRHRLPVRGDPDLVGHRPARRAVGRLRHRPHQRHADHGRTCSVTFDGHRRLGRSGSASFTWTITNSVR